MAETLIGNVKGPQGDAATITVGSVTTGAAGSNASVTNSGTSSAAVLDFTIPKGDKGDAGTPGVTSYASDSAAGLVRVGGDFAISSNGTLSCNTATITEAGSLTNLANGDSLSTILGKIKKAISTVVAIAGDYLKSANIYNGLDQTSSGYVLDATQGKALNDKITALCKYITYKYTYTVSANANLTISATDFGVSVPSGYTVCALSGFTTGSNSVVPRAVNTSSMTIKNLTASEVSAQATITVTYMLSGSISQISQST